jgi:hypothetical protein
MFDYQNVSCLNRRGIAEAALNFVPGFINGNQTAISLPQINVVTIL